MGFGKIDVLSRLQFASWGIDQSASTALSDLTIHTRPLEAPPARQLSPNRKKGRLDFNLTVFRHSSSSIRPFSTCTRKDVRELQQRPAVRTSEDASNYDDREPQASSAPDSAPDALFCDTMVNSEGNLRRYDPHNYVAHATKVDIHNIHHVRHTTRKSPIYKLAENDCAVTCSQPNPMYWDSHLKSTPREFAGTSNAVNAGVDVGVLAVEANLTSTSFAVRSPRSGLSFGRSMSKLNQ